MPPRTTTERGKEMPSRDLVTIREAHKLRPWATERYLRRLVFERRIPYHKLGSKVFVALEDLDSFSEAGRVEATR
jgi:hypothetical protein